MSTGTVKWFNGQKGFGFIQPNDGGNDVFVHVSAVERAGLPGLAEGQKVNFELKTDKMRGKTSAENLSLAWAVNAVSRMYWNGDMPARSQDWAGLLTESLDPEKMVGRKSAEPSPVSVGRANRQRLAQEEGARAMVDVEQSATAIRKNMERLRALRKAREAEEVMARPALPEVAKKKSRRPLSK